jgi:hypothetical protein
VSYLTPFWHINAVEGSHPPHHREAAKPPWLMSVIPAKERVKKIAELAETLEIRPAASSPRRRGPMLVACSDTINGFTPSRE